MKERTRPAVGLLLVWGVVVFFSVYGAAYVRDAIARDGSSSSWPWARQGASALARVGNVIGLAPVRDGVENLRSVINEPYLILARPTGALPVDEAEARIATPVGDDLSHRAAPRKRRVLVVGASSIQYALGVELERRLPTYEGVMVKRVGRLATGLSRPDLFDWAAELDALSRQFRPDLIIANFGGNCAQDIPISERGEILFGTADWDRIYAERVEEIVAVARNHGADMVFAGMPNMRDPTFRAKMEHLNRVQRQAAERAGALWVSTWEMTSTTHGQYKKWVEWQGQRGVMRTIDGIHFRTLGASYVVDEIMQMVERRFVLIPIMPELARAERHTFESRLTGKSISYVAFIPRGASGQNRRPVLYVVPGAQPKSGAWLSYPHRDLQRAAQEHGRVLVVLDENLGRDLIATEVVTDVQKHVAGAYRRGLARSDLMDLRAALDRLDIRKHSRKTMGRRVATH